MTFSLSRKLAAEALGTSLLLMIVVGSGIMGEALSNGNDAIALLANAIATGTGLIVLITLFGPVSGAHFNPAVTFAFLVHGDIEPKTAASFIVIQVAAACFGVFVAHAMFDQSLIQLSKTVRQSSGQSISEVVATFGLVLTIFGAIKFSPRQVAAAVGLFITAGYWFTASTSFANPAVTIARIFTDTFAGIRADDAPIFIGAQFLGAALAVVSARWLFAERQT